MGDKNEFNLLFKDEFDLFDENRWTKGSNTWSGLTSTFTPDNTYVKDGQLVLRAKKTNSEEPQTGGDSDDDEASDDDNKDSDSDDGSDDRSDDESDGEGLKGGSEDDHDSDDDESDSDEGKESDDDEDSEEDSGDNSHEESSEEPDFHVLPSPKSGTLDNAIEKTSRVLVSMVRTELKNFSQSMS